MIARALFVAAVSCATLLHAAEPDTLEFEDDLASSDELPVVQQKRLDLVDRYLKRDPQPVIEGNRLTYLYGEGHPSLICAPLQICTLALAPGERIAANGVLIGDTTRWKFAGVHVAGNDAIHLVLKPTKAGLRTSMTILTTGPNARHYHVELISDPESYMPFVAFRYEDDALADINAMVAKAQGIDDPSRTDPHLENALPEGYGDVSIDDLNFNYDVSGCRDCTWRPERVFDDGTRTIIVLPTESSTQPLPALLIVGADSDAQVVNYRFDDPSYVVDGLFDEARLTLGVGRRPQEVFIRRKSR